MKILLIFPILFLACKPAPRMKIIEKQLGIQFPKHHELVDADSDPFGPGGDQDIKFSFAFDSIPFLELEQSIRASPQFNVAGLNSFQAMETGKKLVILDLLAKKGMSSFWIESEKGYWYNSDSLYMNTNDRVIERAYEQGIPLPQFEHEEHSAGSSEFVITNSVRVSVDRRGRILSYHYIHI